uniref:Uncharacterized protein n=1 Tax=Parascaris univalens TaxID=6257 RepID=A0A915C0M1_PARUN
MKYVLLSFPISNRSDCRIQISLRNHSYLFLLMERTMAASHQCAYVCTCLMAATQQRVKLGMSLFCGMIMHYLLCQFSSWYIKHKWTLKSKIRLKVSTGFRSVRLQINEFSYAIYAGTFQSRKTLVALLMFSYILKVKNFS